MLIADISETVQRLIRFIRTDMWRIRAKRQPTMRAVGLRALRVVVLAVRGFIEDQCPLRASALTFYTLLSIVPVLGVAFGVAKGFGFEQFLERAIVNILPQHEAVTQRIIEFSKAILEETRGGLIAGIGVIILLWTVIKVLGMIEKSLNQIWGVRKPRSIGRKLSDYLSIVLIAPFLLIVSSSMTVALASSARGLIDEYSFLNFVGPAIMFSLKLVPYLMLWALLTFIYVHLPNARVKWTAGLLAGVLAGTCYQLGQWVYLTFQIGVSQYNAIYGSFAALPLFLVWLQLSWLLLLFGAEVSFAYQNVDLYEFEPDCLRASGRVRKLLAVALAQRCVAAFAAGRQPLTAEQLAASIGAPDRLVRELLSHLIDARILSEVRVGEEEHPAYQPARDIATLRIGDVLSGVDALGSDEVPLEDDPAIDDLRRRLDTMREDWAHSNANILLRDLATDGAPAPGAPAPAGSGGASPSAVK